MHLCVSVCVPCSLCSDLCEGPWSTDTDGQTPCRVAHWPAAPPSVEGTVAEAGDSEHSHLAAHPADDIFTWSLWFPIPARCPSRAWSLRSLRQTSRCTAARREDYFSSTFGHCRHCSPHYAPSTTACCSAFIVPVPEPANQPASHSYSSLL
jgi:hypothetical protein